MAGTYPDAIANRMAYERDGTVVLKIDPSNVVTQLTSGDMALMNAEPATADIRYPNGDIPGNSGFYGGCKMVFIFPQQRDIAGYFVCTAQGTASTYPMNYFGRNVSWSNNTSNGVDGTWTQFDAGVNLMGPTITGYRTNQHAAAVGNVKALTFEFNVNSFSVIVAHLFGNITAGQTPDRLSIWHPTLNQELFVTPAFMDWGDVPRGNTATRQFRIKNNSSTLTANTTTVSVDAPTDSSGPTTVSSFSLSTDAVNFFTTINIATLAPGAISGIITIQKATQTNAVFSVWAQRILAGATSWT